MVTLSSRQLTLHHLGSSPGEDPDSSVRLQTLQALHGDLAQLSRNLVLLVVYFPFSESQPLRVTAGLTGKVLWHCSSASK